ncbi:hypothetical protein WI45_29405 [Burkholderia cepacia]|nr:hypothetical protein WI45_29405 [Burkholderia cepacia]
MGTSIDLNSAEPLGNRPFLRLPFVVVVRGHCGQATVTATYVELFTDIVQEMLVLRLTFRLRDQFHRHAKFEV